MGYHKANGEFANVETVTLLPSAARAAGAAVAGTAFELGDRAVARLKLDITAISSGTTIDVTIETSRDNSTWYTSGTFTQVTTTPGAEQKLFMVDRYVRAKYTTVGTSYTFSVSGEAA